MADVRIFLLAFLVVIAGCGGQVEVTPQTDRPTTTFDQSSSPTPTDSVGLAQVEVTGGTLPINATKVWHRVHYLRGQEPPVSFAPTVIVKPLPNRSQRQKISAVEFGYDPPDPPDRLRQFGELMGIGWMEPEEIPSDAVGGNARGTSITIRVGENATSGQIEATLAHEFEHLLQPDGWPYERVPERAVKEGGAVYMEQAYAEQYLSGLDPVNELRKSYLYSSDGGRKFFLSLYYFGYRHFEKRIDSPANISLVYDDRPENYEQLLHAISDETKTGEPLDVRAPNSLENAPVGELFLRVSLATELDASTASRAAAGWGNDTLVPFDGNENFVWVIRMDDQQNASELEVAFKEYLDAKGTQTGDLWRTDSTTYRLVRVTDDTLAIAIGTNEFVTNVSVTGTNGTVEVSASEYK